MVPALPLEIWEQIITHEEYSNATLARLCLVNRQIGMLARAALYLDVVVKYPRDFFYSDNPTSAQQLVDALLNGCGTDFFPSPALLVRNLCTSWKDPLPRDEYVREEDGHDFGEYGAKLITAITSCPGISRLTLSMYEEQYYYEIEEVIWSVLNHLDELTLPPRLERLDLSPLHVWLPLIQGRMSLSAYPTLRSLGFAMRLKRGIVWQQKMLAHSFLDWCDEHGYISVDFDDSYNYIIYAQELCE
ncbi:hypothetical protein NBRC10512_006323 [Rhodotorula toruloides]